MTSRCCCGVAAVWALLFQVLHAFKVPDIVCRDGKWLDKFREAATSSWRQAAGRRESRRGIAARLLDEHAHVMNISYISVNWHGSLKDGDTAAANETEAFKATDGVLALSECPIGWTIWQLLAHIAAAVDGTAALDYSTADAPRPIEMAGCTLDTQAGKNERSADTLAILSAEQPASGFVTFLRTLLLDRWWSEIILSQWAVLLFGAVSLCLEIAIERSGLLDADGIQQLEQVGGPAKLAADAVGLGLTRAFHSFGNTETATADTLVAELDSVQNDFSLVLAEALTSLTPREEVAAAVRVTRALEVLPSFLETLPKGWWYPPDKGTAAASEERTGGASVAWLSLACHNTPVFWTNCMPLVMRSALSFMVSRHRWFIAIDEATMKTVEEQVLSIPFVTFLLRPKIEKSWGMMFFALEHHLNVLERSVSAAAPPQLVLALDAFEFESALSVLFDVDRWLLHGGLLKHQTTKSWDVAWFLRDGFPEAEAAAAACESEGTLQTSASVLALRPSAKALAVMEKLVRVSQFLPQFRHINAKSEEDAATLLDVLATVLAAGNFTGIRPVRPGQVLGSIWYACGQRNWCRAIELGPRLCRLFWFRNSFDLQRLRRW
eukprot:TRINITY_DN65165_c0_g1_i2.p1 TRINITY_DN65165_c0_g1~~TRINITY_DN65165_c0_g1_i2.p1  ORF type:complete len:608 (-),score=119.45 TRINITY_DN65165_c0_g1_i2:1017-2840(-)